MSKIHRVIIASKKEPDIFTIYNLETSRDVTNVGSLHKLFCNPLTEEVVDRMPDGEFIERMYHNGVIDPAQESIQIGCSKLGIDVEAVKVGHRFYGNHRNFVFVNKKVHVVFVNEEPELDTIKMRGSSEPMKWIDLACLSDQQLLKISEDNDLSLSLEEMKELRSIQKDLELKKVNDVFLETFAARWSDHCCHKKWRALGLFEVLKGATKEINNPNLISAFVDNAGGWKFFEDLVICLKLETHNSPTQKEPYGGQLTKLGGVLRDIFEYALGAKPIADLEMTVVGEFLKRVFKELEGQTLTAQVIARETIRAIADYGNRMGIPMALARMFSHPNFGGKTFALGGTVGITTEDAAQKGEPQPGDLVMIVGGRTGNDGFHGATVSSGELTEKTDAGDACHVQIGNPYTEQKMMRAGLELRDAGCLRARNDFGAAGIVSAIGEMGENTGVIMNIAAMPLKCLGLPPKVVCLSESQERFAHAVKPEKLAKAIEIYKRYQLEYAVMGVFTGNNRMQIISDESLPEADYKSHMGLSGEVLFDVPYTYFDRCPLPRIEIIEPPPKTNFKDFPDITPENVQKMAEKTVGHFDVCNQSFATTQYDSTVQGITFQGPLYGKNYNVSSSLAALTPVYGKSYAVTVSKSFSPWQFEIDPANAAINAVLDAVATQVAAGVKLEDVCLADNFYTPHKDPYAYWHLRRQVEAIAELSKRLSTPFTTGKDSSSGSAVYGDFVINVLCSVCITAMGKIEDANRLVLHQWQKPGNLLFLVGPTAKYLDGSILASALGLGGKGSKLDSIPLDEARFHMEKVSRLVRSGVVKSAVPVNRGGIMLRLFEGVEASGFGIKTELCQSLFTEPFGSVLVEVPQNKLHEIGQERSLVPVGVITEQKGINVMGRKLNWDGLYSAWNTTFKREVMS